MGDSGTWISDALPQLSQWTDQIAVIKSMHTEQFNHAPAQLMLYTGSPRVGRPSLGSWVTYGIGSPNQNLPGFVVLISGGTNPSAGKTAWGSGFLPSVFQGVQCRSKGDPVLYVSDPAGMDRALRRKSLDALNDLNMLQANELGDPETMTRIAQYELAFRMQMSVPDAMDISQETQSTIEAYGAQPGESSFGNNCLLARRLVEKGCTVSCRSLIGDGTSTVRIRKKISATGSPRSVVGPIRRSRHYCAIYSSAGFSTQLWSSSAASLAGHRFAKDGPRKEAC